MDWPILGFTVALTSVAALVAAAPALRHARDREALRGTHGETRRGIHIRWVLAATQIALAVVLLTGGALLARTVTSLLSQDVGIDAGGTVVTQLLLSDAVNFQAGAESGSLGHVLEGVRALPGVVSAGATSSLPPASASLVMTLRVVADGAETTTPELTVAAVTPGYLEAVGCRLLRGRFFDAADDRREGLAIVLSASAARALSPGLDPLGTALPIYLPGLRQRGHPTVIGTVADVKYSGLETAPGPAVYLLWRELPASRLFLAVRTAADSRSLVPLLRSAIVAADPGTPVMPIRSLEDEMRTSIADRRARALLGGTVALLALAIAMVGVAGGIGRLIAERRREFAIRSALGATPSRTVRMVLGEGTRVIGSGTALGLGAALAAGGLLRSALYGVGPRDAATLVGVASGVMILSLAVWAVPARRAAAVDPMEVLRER